MLMQRVRPLGPETSVLRRIVLSAATMVAMAFAVQPAAAAQDPVYTGYFSSVAVSGYDTVAYFTEGRPTEGSEAYETEYKGYTYRFASQANLDLFVADPEAYVPQYGGYCAWAVAQGYTASADPDNWAVVDGKLYLNYDDSVQAKWQKDVPGFIEKADRNWPAVLE